MGRAAANAITIRPVFPQNPPAQRDTEFSQSGARHRQALPVITLRVTTVTFTTARDRHRLARGGSSGGGLPGRYAPVTVRGAFSFCRAARTRICAFWLTWESVHDPAAGVGLRLPRADCI
jgi:hypothetical protein